MASELENLIVLGDYSYDVVSVRRQCTNLSLEYLLLILSVRGATSGVSTYKHYEEHLV